MKWSSEAGQALQALPAAARKSAAAAIEARVAKSGRAVVERADLQAARETLMAAAGEQIRGYQVKTCFGAAGCPNPACFCGDLIEKIKNICEKADLLGFLKKTAPAPLKHHHELRIAASDCPNACSQPQIKDIGIIGAVRPALGPAPCDMCESCRDACQDQAISFQAGQNTPVIDTSRCLRCGQCHRACPTGTIVMAEQGYRLMLGGRLGRHPRLAREIPERLFSQAQVLAVVQQCLIFYKNKADHGQRFSKILTDRDITTILEAAL